ncbi:major tail protein [Vibrio phage 382E49-1]|nr:major tail protein [Vibrio phage 141O35-1]CAH9015366.1 major tail protein [Vibrio phage 141E35-1]CAH9016045.1 major tail protein [Vibrio phage 382E49-1]
MSCENNKAADSNATGLAVTKSDMPATATTPWLYMEPNEISSFASTIEKVARDPITKDRQRRKGSITSVATAPQFTADMTLEMISYFAPGFLFSVWKGLQPNSYGVVETSGGNTYTVETGGAVLAAGALVFADGFVNPENNGLKTVASATATTLVVNETLVDETAASTVRLYAVGVRGATGDLQIDAEQNLTSTALDFTTLGLTPGQYINIGGALAANQFTNASGKARIAQIEANRIVLEARDAVYTADVGTGKEVDILFSAFVRNVPVGDVDFLKQWYHMEAAYNTDPMLYEYADCCINNTLAINNALQDKAVLDLAFVGKDLLPPNDTPRDGVRSNQTETEPFNTSSDIMRLRVSDVDDNGLSTFFKDTNISINNNVAAEYVLGQLAAEFMNFGNFEVDIETTAVFTDAILLNAIRNNTTLGIDMAYKNGDGGFVLSLPCGTFGDGSKSLPRNEKVKLTTPFMAHRDEDRGYTMSVSLFWYLP